MIMRSVSLLAIGLLVMAGSAMTLAMAHGHPHGTDAHAVQQQSGIGHGTVNSIDRSSKTINISHEAIESLGMPPMTMNFDVADPKLLDDIEPGMKVTFRLEKTSSGGFLIDDIKAASP